MAVRVDRELHGRVQTLPRPARPRTGQARVRPHVRPQLPRRHQGVVSQGSRAAFHLWDWLYRGYRTANAGDLAAAVAFNALVALVPTALLLLSIAGFLLRNN